MKKALALALVFALCFALAGCQSLVNLFNGFGQMFGGGDESSSAVSSVTPEEAASSSSRSVPAASSSSSSSSSMPLPPSSSSTAPSSQDPATPGAANSDLTLNTMLTSLPHMSNGEFKKIFDPDLPADASIVMGGIPYLSYAYEETGVHMTLQYVEGEQDLFEAWHAAERRDGSMPGYNCFPDDCEIAYVVLSGGPATLDLLFGPDGEKSYDAICEYFGQTPGLILLPADPPEYENSEFYEPYDRQFCIFNYGDVKIRLMYTNYGSALEFVGVSLYIDDPYGFYIR